MNRDPDSGQGRTIASRLGGVVGWLSAVIAAGGLAVAVGCTTATPRDFKSISFRQNEYFRVQFLLPEEVVERPIPVDSLLLLPPVGLADEEQATLLMLSIWQELQQILPGIVRTPRRDGPYVPYIGASNLMMDDGRLNEEELERIGRLAGTSHLLVARVINYRPYHPQSIIMEWVLLDVAKKQPVLIMAGSLDAAEQKVLNAAGNYVNNRRSEPTSAGSVDVLLRSPREYSRFAAAQAVDALKGWLRPASDVYVPYLSY